MKKFPYTSKIFGCLLAILAIAFGGSGSVYAQATQSGCLAYLTQSHGFKDLLLGADIKTLPGDQLAYLDDDATADADGCYKLAYQNNDILQLGDGVSLDKVGVRTFKGQIVNIYLFFKREDGYKVLQNLMAYYGHYTNSTGDFMYDWNTGPVTLALRYEVDTDLGVAVFTSNQLTNKIAQAHNNDNQTLAASNITGRTL